MPKEKARETDKLRATLRNPANVLKAETKALRKMYETFNYQLEKATEEGSDTFDVMFFYPTGSEAMVETFIREKKDEEGWRQYRFELGAEVVVD